MRFSHESVDQLVRDGMDLFRANAKETSDNPDDPINIDVEKYKNLEQLGRVVVFCARDEFKLVGYSLFIIDEHHQKKGVIQAFQDVLYVSPEYRGQNSIDFIDHSLAELKKFGVHDCYIPTKMKNSLGKLLERKGFRKSEEIYLRRLQDV